MKIQKFKRKTIKENYSYFTNLRDENLWEELDIN